jgi:predicted glutamine amidotransferase/DNA-directed RNA polymerase subunit RPC12/RpoP
MCGHVGIAGNLEFKDEATLKRLLVLDYFRGPDSTGLAVIKKDLESHGIVKLPSHPLDLFEMEKFKKLLSAYQSAVFMGHNRAATKGKVNGFNAHPYEFGHIIGCHNGTLDLSSWKALEAEIDENYDVDSQAIFAAIAKLGIKKTVPLLQGAWALVWFDLNEGTLNFLRNDKRPFWYAFTDDFKKIFWASEWEMIDASINMSTHKYKLHTEGAEGYRFWQTPVNLHMKWDIDALRKGSENRPKPTVCELKGKEPAPVATAAGHDPFNRTSNTSPNKPGQTTTTTSTTTFRGKTSASSSADTIVHLFGDKTAPFGDLLSEERFANYAKYGCSWCGTDVAFDDVGITILEHTQSVLCPSCSLETDHNRVYTTDIDKVIAN